MNEKQFFRQSMALRTEFVKSELKIYLLDQTVLPHQETWLQIDELGQMIEAIKSLRVRGAPLIGVAASLMVARLATMKESSETLLQSAQKLYEARPTAVNLMICIDRMKIALREKFTAEQILVLALQIFDEDVQLCEKMAVNGAALIQDGDQILTHCNTGGLATAGIGTALGVIRKAHEQGKKIHVYVDETRPLLQGGRLTAWELQKLNIPCTLITDNMAPQLMSLGKITKAIVGSDRIAMNGDFANKIGTYGVAVSCFYHKIPFFVTAPYTTIDPECANGSLIPIEQRKSEEVTGVEGSFGSVRWAPERINVYNPAFDVTPAALVANWILDRGVFNQDEINKGALKKCLA